jgi:hypothetical protein
VITPEQLARNNDEHGHQAALFCWAAQNKAHEPRLELMFAIPNGGQRNKATAANLVAEGVKNGVPDIFLPVPSLRWGLDQYVKQERHLSRNWFTGMFIEMKRPSERLKRSAIESKWDTGGVKPNQAKWLTLLELQGYHCVVCYHWLEAANAVKLYLTGTPLPQFLDEQKA